VELVDFHIATGGDQFDIGPTGVGDDEIPTDALEGPSDVPVEDRAGSAGVDAAPVEQKTSGGSEVSDEVLPDWLLEASGLAAPARGGPRPPAAPVDRSLNMETDGANREGDAPKSDDARGTSGVFSESADLEVELLLDDEPVEANPFERPPGRRVDSDLSPARQAKQPRDMRVGLVVAAALSMAAVAVLLWSLWLRPDERTSATPPDSSENVASAAASPGVELVEGDASSVEEASEKSLVSEEAPVAPVVPPPSRPVEASEVTTAPATRVEDVMAAARPGQTTVVIRGNGSFTDEAVDVKMLRDPPRIWLRIRHIERFYRPNELTVGSPEVDRVRIGHHPEESPSSLYVVLDVADEAVVVTKRSVEGNTISVTVARR
jgi:hypothetical protein